MGYKEGHSVKGKSVFLEQMSKFIEWLQSAEEESESGGEEDWKRQYSAVSPLTRNVVSNSLHCCQPCCNRNIPPFFNNFIFFYLNFLPFSFISSFGCGV